MFGSPHVLDMIINSAKEIYVATFKKLTAYSTDLKRTIMSFNTIESNNDCKHYVNLPSRVWKRHKTQET